MPGIRTNSGRRLNREWAVDANHALYHKDGTFYENLERFPGALFDLNGYVLFKTLEEYESCPYLDRGEKLNIRGGISKMPGYIRNRPHNLRG